MSTKKKDSALSGMLSSAITVRKVRGQVVVTNRPRQRPEPTAKQLAVQARFTEASQYANRQMEQPDSLALYNTGITPKKGSAYSVAVSDYLIPPTVEWIDAADYRGNIGDPIVVKAVDDFQVTRVRVTILNAAGAIIEQGEAGPDSMKVNQWGYTAQVSNPVLAGATVRATAFDRPGNSATLEVKL